MSDAHKIQNSTYIATGINFRDLKENRFKLMGAWCSTNSHDVDSSQVQMEIVNLLPEFEYDPEYIADLYFRLIPNLAMKLNTIHKLNISDDQWETIIGYWLLTMLHPLYDRWQRLNSITSVHDKIELIVCERKHDFNPTLTSMEDKRIETNHEFNSYIYESMLRWFKSINLRYVEAHVPVLSRDTQKGIFEKILSPLLTLPRRAKLCMVPGLLNFCRFTKLLRHQKHFLITSYIPLRAQLRLALKTRSPVFLSYINNLVFHYAKPTPLNNNADRELTRIEGLTFTNEFEEYISENLFRFIPRSIYEDFQSHVGTLQMYNLDYAPRSTISELLHSAGSDLGRIWMGLYGNRDRQLLVLQHGGAYGHYKTMWSYFFESRVSSCFLSWGWAELYSSEKLVNVPALRLQAKNKSRVRKSTRILILLPPEFIYPHLYHPTQPMDGTQTRYHLEVVKNFVAELSKANQQSVSIKVQKAYFENLYQVFGSGLANINLIGTSTPIPLQSFNLLVSSYAGTNTVECLLSNRPTIMLWPEPFCNFSNESVSVMHQLEVAGVLHENYTSAARIVNLDDAHLFEWWNSHLVREAVNNYLSLFGSVIGGTEAWASKVNHSISINLEKHSS